MIMLALATLWLWPVVYAFTAPAQPPTKKKPKEKKPMQKSFPNKIKPILFDVRSEHGERLEGVDRDTAWYSVCAIPGTSVSLTAEGLRTAEDHARRAHALRKQGRIVRALQYEGEIDRATRLLFLAKAEEDLDLLCETLQEIEDSLI